MAGSPEALQLLADLDAVLVGSLGQFRPGLAAPDHPLEAVPLEALLVPEMVDRIIERFHSRFGRTDPRAVLSLWASSHFTSVLPAVLSAHIMLDRCPALNLGCIGFIISPDLRAAAIKIGPDVVHTAGLGVFERFDTLLQGYLAPLIRLFALRGRVTERVLWSNAGYVFDAFLGMIEPVAAGREGLAQARRLLQEPAWPDGGRNPLFQPVRLLDGRRTRRVCCMRFLVPDGKVCKACPLETDSPARFIFADPARCVQAATRPGG